MRLNHVIIHIMTVSGGGGVAKFVQCDLFM